MSGKNNKKFKLAVCLLAIFGVSIFGLQQAKAVNVNNQSGLEDTNNYRNNEALNVTGNINLNSGNLPDIQNAVNAVVNGNNHTISGGIFNSDRESEDNSLTYGHYTVQNNSSLTFNNIGFSTNTDIGGTDNWAQRNSRDWRVFGLIAQNMASNSSMNINSSIFANNVLNLHQQRNGNDTDVANWINGGFLNNAAGSMNITSTNFTGNNVTVETTKNDSVLLPSGKAHSYVYGGIISNYENAELNITGGTISTNSVQVTSNGAGTDDSVIATVQGGVINNEGTALIDGVQINDNTVSASTNDNGDNATAQGGAIYNAQGAILTIQGNTSFAGNSVSASGATSNTAQGGAIYNAGAINVSGGSTVFSNNSANNAANDIYFADGSTMSLTEGSTVTLSSGIQSQNQNAQITVEGTSNLIQNNTNSSAYRGQINIQSNGLLTFKGQDLGVINSLNNAEINLSQNSGLGFEIENNITLDAGNVMANFDTITPNGTLNIYKTGDNEMTLAGDFDGIADEYNISGGKLIASDENLASNDTVNVNNAEFEYSTKGEIVNNVSLSNGSTYTINANSGDEAITINNSPVFNGANNTVNLENGNYDLNTNFRSDEIQNININSSNVSFRGGGISQNTTVTDSVLNLSNNNIETTTFLNLTSNNSSVNLDIDLSNGKSDTIIAGSDSDGSLNLGELTFIGAASETKYNFEVITGGNLAFSDYSGTFESKVYKYAVRTEEQNITLNATGIASNGLKYYNHTLTGNRTFSFIGDEIYKIGQDLESTNAGGFIVNGKNETAKDSIISGDDFHSFFEVSDNKLTVNNVTIQDALASNLDELLEGASTNTDGAVLNISGGSAEFNNVILQNNKAEGSGGVISATAGSVVINNSEIQNNNAVYGGAINAYNDAKITINDSTISNNSATEGSAIYNAMGGSVILNDVEISNNTGSSSIYNEGENSTVSITNEKDNIINNGDNAVIKNTGTINITANNDTLTTIQDAIQNLDITDITTDTKGNIETKGNVTFSDITKQIVTQTNSTVQIENLTGSKYIANGNLYISGNVNSSIITSNAKAPDDGSYSLDLNVAEDGSEITLNDGSAYIQSLNDSKLTVNGGRAENINFVNKNSEVYINGGSYSGIGTISNGTTVTINNGVEGSNTAISTANDSTIINTLGTTKVHNSNNTDIKNSGTISVENLQSGSSFTQTKGTSTITNAIEKSVIDIDGGTSTITQGNDVTITVDNSELNLGSDTATNALTNSSLTIGNAAEANLTGGNISGGEITLAAAQDSLNAGILNISGKDTTISSALKGGGTINKTEGGKLDLEGADGANAEFTGEINVSNKGTLAFDQNSTLNKDANINLDNSSTFNFVLTNAENISLTDDGFSTVNLTNSSTMNVVGKGLNQDIQIQVGNGFWTSDNTGNTLNFANASYNLINEQGASEAANGILTFTSANLTLEENQTWENKIALDNTTLDLSNQSAGETYEFNHLDVSKDNNDLNIDVNLNIDNGAPVADQIIVNEGSGILELTQVFITDDNGGIVNYKDDEGNAIPIQIIQNVGENASVQLETNEDIEILSWSTNVYKYSINSAISDKEQGLIDSITVDPNGVASSDTLRDLNHYEGNRGFSFVIKGEDGQAVENKYQIYRDLDTTAAGNLTVIGRVDENGKSILSGELKELVIDENDQRYDAQNSTYTYLGPEQADGQRDVVDTAKVNEEPTLKDGEYTFAIGAMDNDNPPKENGSLFELTNATNLKITDVSLEDAYRGETDTIKNGSAIYANNNSATVELNNVDFKNNTVSSGSGGAVANELSQSFLLDGSVIAGNSASENGGAFYNTSSGETKIQNATFYGNSAGNLGGAIYTNADMTIVNSNFGKDTNNVDNFNYIGTEPDKVANDIYIDKKAKLTFEVNENAVNKTSIIASGIMGSETSSFIKTGTGTLNLSGNNKDFKGDFILAEYGGKVLYEADSTDDSFVSGDVSIGQDSALEMEISNRAVSESITQNINNVSGTGEFIKSGQGALNLGGDNSGFTGTAQIDAGSLNYLADNNTDNYFLGATKISENAKLNLTINDGISNNVNEISGDGTVNKFESGTVILSGNNSGFEGTLNINEGILEYRNSDDNSPEGTSYISGVTNMTKGSVFIANTDGLNYEFTDEINSSFKGEGTFIKEGFGTLKLSGVLKDLTGDVKIQTGNLEFIKNEDNGYINGNTFVGSGNTFIYNTNGIDSTLSHNIEDLTQGEKGNFEKTGDGTLTLQGDYSNFTGAATISEGTLKYVQNQGKYFGGHTNVDENGTLIFDTNGINSEISNITQSTEIGGTFIKQGEGTLKLTGDNEYLTVFNGETEIKKGILNYIADNNTDSYFKGSTTISNGAALQATINENVNNQTITNIISENAGDGTFIKDGAGSLNLTGNNSTFSGKTQIEEGVLNYIANLDTDKYFSGSTTISQNGVLQATINDKTVSEISNIISENAGDGTFIKDGAGSLNLTGNNSTFSGETQIKEGVLNYIANNDTDSYFKGSTTISADGTLQATINESAGENQTIANIKSENDGNGTFIKQGAGSLKLTGDNSEFSGSAQIKKGILNYIADNDTDSYFKGSTTISADGTLKTTVNQGITSEISNITSEDDNDGTFIKDGAGSLKLTGKNDAFKGNAFINQGTLAFSNADGSTYFAGATTISNGAILAYTTGDYATLNNFTGQGTINKSGTGTLAIEDYKVGDAKFSGNLNVNEGKVTVKGADDANPDFDFNMTVNNGNLVYNAAQNQNYNIGTVDSKVSFGENVNGATITFNGGNYNLAGDIQNAVAVNNITKFTDATLTLGSKNYNGNYKLSGGNVVLSDDNVYSHHTFNNLEALNTNLSLDLEFKNPADETKYDKITVNSGNAKFNLISVNMIPDDGVNDTGGSAEDSGQDKTITFDILNGNATFNNNQSLSSYATNKYIYSVDYVDDQKIVFTQTGYSDGNTLKGQNIDKGSVREFQFDNDITLNNPYLLDEDLTTTHEGIFTVLGYKDDTAEEPVTVIDGSNDHSMFEVGDNTTLNVSDIHFTNAKASMTDIEGEDKSSKGIHGSILALTGGSATLDNVKATNNASDGKGGAIYVNGGNLTLNDIYFENNTHKLSADTEIDNDIYVEGGKTVNITGDSTVKSGLAGEGTVNTSGNFNLEGNNKDFKGTLLVSSGQATFTQNDGDTFISGTTEISKNADAIINNNYSEIEGTFKGEGNLTKEGSENLVLIGDNSLMTGNVTVEEGHIVLNTDGAAYFGGNTELKDNTGIIVSGSKDADLSNVSGSENSTVEKSGSGKLTFGGNGKYEGTVNIHEGALGLNYNSNYAIANANFASGTSLNLQNTVAINQNGQWTTNPNPSGIETITFDNINLEGPVDLFLDIDLKQGVADKIAANTVEGSGYLVLGYDGINAVTDALRDDSSVQIATGAITDYIKLEEEDMKVMGPIEEYLIGYDDGMLNFTKTGGNHPKYSQVNPGIMAGAVAAQMGGYLVQLNSYDEAFRNMDMYMLMTKKQREAMKHRNKYAYNGSSGIIYDASISRHENKSGWLRPFATFEQVDLDGGPDVSNVSYGSYFGMDSEFIDLGHGWDGVWSAYAGYNGSHQSYDGIGIYQNGGTLGVVGMAYKGNFFTGLTVNAGASAGRANVDMGYDDFTMLMSGVASKTGYNFELFDGKFIIQPSYMMSYSFVNTFDYTSAQGARVTSDPLHAIHIEPGIKFIGNLKNGWQPYMGISMIWNVMDKTRFMANEVYLPELSIKPFVKYGVGLRKSWGERFTGYLQTYITNGGRNGVGLQAGFNWALGKPVVRERQAFGITPSVESVKFAKKTK